MKAYYNAVMPCKNCGAEYRVVNAVFGEALSKTVKDATCNNCGCRLCPDKVVSTLSIIVKDDTKVEYENRIMDLVRKAIEEEQKKQQ